MIDPREQFSLVYDQYIEKIYRFVYVKVSSQETAQDLTSKVFLKGWEAYQRGENIKNPGAFLYQIARNMVIDHYREKGKEKTVSMDNVGQVADLDSNPHEKAVAGADAELVKSAISRLKPDYQDVLILHYLEDMPAGQVAKGLHKPAVTVRVMIHRGLKMLKEELIREN